MFFGLYFPDDARAKWRVACEQALLFWASEASLARTREQAANPRGTKWRGARGTANLSRRISTSQVFPGVGGRGVAPV